MGGYNTPEAAKAWETKFVADWNHGSATAAQGWNTPKAVQAWNTEYVAHDEQEKFAGTMDCWNRGYAHAKAADWNSCYTTAAQDAKEQYSTILQKFEEQSAELNTYFTNMAAIIKGTNSDSVKPPPEISSTKNPSQPPNPITQPSENKFTAPQFENPKPPITAKQPSTPTPPIFDTIKQTQEKNQHTSSSYKPKSQNQTVITNSRTPNPNITTTKPIRTNIHITNTIPISKNPDAFANSDVDLSSGDTGQKVVVEMVCQQIFVKNSITVEKLEVKFDSSSEKYTNQNHAQTFVHDRGRQARLEFVKDPGKHLQIANQQDATNAQFGRKRRGKRVWTVLSRKNRVGRRDSWSRRIGAIQKLLGALRRGVRRHNKNGERAHAWSRLIGKRSGRKSCSRQDGQWKNLTRIPPELDQFRSDFAWTKKKRRESWSWRIGRTRRRSGRWWALSWSRRLTLNSGALKLSGGRKEECWPRRIRKGPKQSRKEKRPKQIDQNLPITEEHIILARSRSLGGGRRNNGEERCEPWSRRIGRGRKRSGRWWASSWWHQITRTRSVMKLDDDREACWPSGIRSGPKTHRFERGMDWTLTDFIWITRWPRRAPNIGPIRRLIRRGGVRGESCFHGLGKFQRWQARRRRHRPEVLPRRHSRGVAIHRGGREEPRPNQIGFGPKIGRINHGLKWDWTDLARRLTCGRSESWFRQIGRRPEIIRIQTGCRPKVATVSKSGGSEHNLRLDRNLIRACRRITIGGGRNRSKVPTKSTEFLSFVLNERKKKRNFGSQSIWNEQFSNVGCSNFWNLQLGWRNQEDVDLYFQQSGNPKSNIKFCFVIHDFETFWIWGIGTVGLFKFEEMRPKTYWWNQVGLLELGLEVVNYITLLLGFVIFSWFIAWILWTSFALDLFGFEVEFLHLSREDTTR